MIRRLAVPLLVAALCSAWSIGALAQTRALVLTNCPTAPEHRARSLLGLLIPELIAAGVDLAGTALSEAATAKLARASFDSEPFAYYTLDETGEVSRSLDLGCLVLVRGGETPSPRDATLAEWETKVQQSIKTVKSTPDFYMEIALLPRRNNDGLLLAPRWIFVGKPIGEMGWWSRDARSYVAAVTLRDASSLEPYGAASFTFTGVEPGVAYTESGEPGSTRLAGWPQEAAVPKLPAPEDMNAAVSAQKSRIATRVEVNGILRRAAKRVPPQLKPVAGESEYGKALDELCSTIEDWNRQDRQAWIRDARCPRSVFDKRRALAQTEETLGRKLSLAWAQEVLAICRRDQETRQDGGVEVCTLPAPSSAEVGYAQVSVAMAETTEPGKFIQLLAGAFNSKKDAVKTALNDRLNPDRRAELAAQKAGAERDARDAYEIDLLKVKQLGAQLSEAADKPASEQLAIQIQLTQAKLQANKSARAAGKAEPYPEYK